MTKSAGNRQLFSDVRSLMVLELKNRQAANARYSLRAFARDLGLNQSFLSRVLRGERNLSQNIALQVALALGVPGEKLSELFVDKSKKAQTHKLTDEELSILTDWYPFAILELAHTVGFKPDSKLIASRLGLTNDQVDYGIRRLVASKILVIEADGSWTLSRSSQNWVSSSFTSVVRKRLQKQILSMAQESIDIVPIEERENLSMTVAVNSEALPEIRQRIREFNESLRQYINSFEKRDAVFQFAIAAYPLTKKNSTERSSA